MELCKLEQHANSIYIHGKCCSQSLPPCAISLSNHVSKDKDTIEFLNLTIHLQIVCSGNSLLDPYYFVNIQHKFREKGCTLVRQ